MIKVLIPLLLLIILTGCGQMQDSSPFQPHDFQISDLIGMNELTAIDKAHDLGYTTRVVKRDQNSIYITMEYIETRLSLTISDNIVIKLYRG